MDAVACYKGEQRDLRRRLWDEVDQHIQPALTQIA
jgi:hypothetical protein